MHVFLTGATGFVGSEVTRQLLASGHKVTGLARSDAGAAALVQAGAAVLRGELTDTAALTSAVASADAVIHCGFIHDFSNYAQSAKVDVEAIAALGDGLAGSGKPLLVTSGTSGLSFGQQVTEDDAAPTPAPGVRASEAAALAQVERGVRASVIRLPPSVHGDHDHGFVPTLIGLARQHGNSAYIGDGANRWASVHVADAARVYVAALEKGEAGARYHAVQDEAIAFRDIAGAIAKRLGLATVSVTPDGAGARFGWLARFAGMDVPAASTLTRQRLGWTPVGSRLLADLDTSATYFA